MRGVSIDALGKLSKCKTLAELAATWARLQEAGDVGEFQIKAVCARSPPDGSTGFILTIDSGNVVPRKGEDAED